MKSSSELQQRKDLVLGIVVNEYVRTVTPISSGQIVEDYLSELSSATVRNILAELENEGFLTHPHTSAGRVPTQEGYRYFVDNLMMEIQLLEEEQKRIRSEYEQHRKDLELILDRTAQDLSKITQCTSIITIDGCSDRVICRGTSHVVKFPEPTNLEKIRCLLQALEEKQQLLNFLNGQIEERAKVYIGHEIACQEMDNCSLAVSRYKAGHEGSGRIAVLGPTRMDYSRVVSALDYFTKLVDEIFEELV